MTWIQWNVTIFKFKISIVYEEKGEVKNEACVTMDKKEAIKYFKHGIEKEDSTAMVNYEYMIENGEDTEMNKEKSD